MDRRVNNLCVVVRDEMSYIFFIFFLAIFNLSSYFTGTFPSKEHLEVHVWM